MKSIRSWGQLIIHINKRFHVGYILLKDFAFAEETSNSLEVTFNYCLRRRMLAGLVATSLSMLWRQRGAADVAWSVTGGNSGLTDVT
jgi:hypothetical protein